MPARRYREACQAAALARPRQGVVPKGAVALIGQNLLGSQTEFRTGQSQPRRGWITFSLEY